MMHISSNSLLKSMKYVCPEFTDATAYIQSKQVIIQIALKHRNVMDIRTTNAKFWFHSTFGCYMNID